MERAAHEGGGVLEATRGRGLAVACGAYAVIAVAFWLTIRYASDGVWPATVLLYTLRWPLVLPMAVLLPLATRRRRLWWAPLITGLFVLVIVMDLHVPWRRPTQGTIAGQHLRLLTCNVHRLELNIPVLERYVLQTDPDVIALQDYSGWDDSDVLSRGRPYGYRVGEIFLTSRFPIRSVHDLQLESITGEDDLEFPRRAGSAFCFVLELPGGDLRIVNLHLASPHHAIETLVHDPERAAFLLRTGSLRRRRESRMVTDYLAASGKPMLLTGDFNMPAESPIYREYWARFADAFTVAGWGYGFTHCTPLSELRIDHVLMPEPIRCTGVSIGPPCGTPHRPMVVDLTIAPEALDHPAASTTR